MIFIVALQLYVLHLCVFLVAFPQESKRPQDSKVYKLNPLVTHRAENPRTLRGLTSHTCPLCLLLYGCQAQYSLDASVIDCIVN
jgi:hypothetical protein